MDWITRALADTATVNDRKREKKSEGKKKRQQTKENKRKEVRWSVDTAR
jgi:hypothetical protein